jgi:DHA2 family multidrug resistance protein-like MFS transporter
MAVLDGQIANTALPAIARDLRASPTASIWVVNAFQLAVTATLFTFASLGGLKGSARVYRVGVIVFILGSLFSALSRSLPELIAARALQGIGASGIMSLSPALLRDIFPSSQLGRALGLNALVVATAAAAGPTVGGLLLSVSSWPILFAVNIPLGLANVVLNRALPDDRRNEGQLDVPSAISSALGFALTIYGLDGFAHNEPPAMIAIPLAIGLISGWYFVRRQFRLPRPMIALDLFHVPTFAIASATSLATFTAQGIAYVALPFFFQVALGRTPLQSGLLLSSWPLATAIVAPIAGRLSDRYPVGILATIGLAVLTIGLTSYARLPSVDDRDRHARDDLRPGLRVLPVAEQSGDHRHGTAREDDERIGDPRGGPRQWSDTRRGARRDRLRRLRRACRRRRERGTGCRHPCGADGPRARGVVRRAGDGRERLATAAAFAIDAASHRTAPVMPSRSAT